MLHLHGDARERLIWRSIGAVLVLAFCWTAISNTAYVATTPHTVPHHGALRKLFALGAFAVVGFVAYRSRLSLICGIASIAVAVAAFSWIIEIGQIAIDHSTETFLQHAYDVFSGLAGGALGSLLAMMSVRTNVARKDLAIVAIVLAGVVVAYPWTYGALR